jgi:hypothetical protein
MINKITIFIGDTGAYLAQEAKKVSESACLLDSLSTHILKPGIYYTSLGDCYNEQILLKILNQADVLIYCPPDIWSDGDTHEFSMRKTTEFYLRFFINKKQVLGVDTNGPDFKSTMLELADVRRSENPQIWISGCSISHGIGQGIEADERYGEHLSHELNMPVSYLTRPGTSNAWQAQQILRSDLRPGDIIVWGLTSWDRFTFVQDKPEKFTHVNVRYYERYPEFHKVVSLERLLETNNLLYHSLTSIHQVVNVCQKLGVKLLLAGLLVDRMFIQYLVDLPNYIQLLGYNGFEVKNMYPDQGTDGRHPGPLSHRWFADEMIKGIKQL